MHSTVFHFWMSPLIVMFHGPPLAKIKRELTPSKELSHCHQDRSPMPYREKCLYSYGYAMAHSVCNGPRSLQSLQSLLIIPLWSNVFLPVCHFIHSACERKPTPGFKPLTPPSTPVSPCGTTGTAVTHPASEQTPPPHPHVANPTQRPHPVHLQQSLAASAGSSRQQALPVHSHSPSFAMPCAPISQDANNFTSEHRHALHIFHLLTL